MRAKLVITFVAATIIPLVVIVGYTNYSSSIELEKEAKTKLQAISDLKRANVTNYFKMINDQISTFSENLSTREAMVHFNSAYNEYMEESEYEPEDLEMMRKSVLSYYTKEFAPKFEKENKTKADIAKMTKNLRPIDIALQYAYISKNPNPLGSKDALIRAKGDSTYHNLHEKYHPPIRSFLEKNEYYDIFLVDHQSGNIVYSVYKELDYSTSLIDGPYASTNFARAFRRARQLKPDDKKVIVDYESYLPSYNAPASFIASPIFISNKLVGVAIFQMPIDRLNKIMADSSGLGQSGESYIVGEDYLMRSDAAKGGENFTAVASFRNTAVSQAKTVPVQKALSGQSGTIVAEDYLGRRMLSSYAPFSLLGQHQWAFISSIAEEEALLAVRNLRNSTLITILSAIIFLIAISYYISNKLSKSLGVVANELIDSARSFSGSCESVSHSAHQLESNASHQSNKLKDTVENTKLINGMAEKNAGIAASSTRMSTDSQTAAKLGQQKVDEMIEAIGDISTNNQKIMNEMEENNAEISSIVDVISKIESKTKVINEIVFQTKLLSFNASVEAARAGEHGKGFAVVAEEVGNLASMSGTAATEITGLLEHSIKHVTDIVTKSSSNLTKLVSQANSKVDQGRNIAKDCGIALEDITRNVQSVNNYIEDIARSSKEQSEKIGNMMASMQDFEKTTIENALMAKNSTKDSLSLREEVQKLNTVISDLQIIISGSSHNEDEEEYYEDQEEEDEAAYNEEEKKENAIDAGKKSTPHKDPTIFSAPSKVLPIKKEEKIDLKRQANASIRTADGLEVPDKDDDRFVDI